MKVNIISESEFLSKDHGVHTAYLSSVVMAQRQGIDVVVNSLRSADLVHVHTIGPLGYYSLQSAKKSVISAHVVPESFVGSLKGTKYWLGMATRYLRHIYNQADLVFAVAPKVKEQLELIGVTSRIEVLPNPVNSLLFKPDRKLKESGRAILGISERQKVVMSVGQVQPRKGVTDFITMAKSFPDAIFIWVGGRPFKSFTATDTALEEALQNPPPNFFLKGPFSYEQMPAVVNAGDIFFFPSYQENAPMSPLEAAACGLPLLLRDIPEYKLLYKTGYLGGSNTEQFTHELKKLLSDASYYKKWQEQAQNLAHQFSIDIVGAALIRYYQSIL